MVFSEIESDVGSCLHRLAGTTPQSALYPLVDKLVFKHKIDTMRQIALKRFAKNRDCLNEFKPLHRAAQRMRVRRNAFIHGRWDPETTRFVLSNASYNPQTRQTETSWTLPALQDELMQLKCLSETLRAWRDRWTAAPTSPADAPQSTPTGSHAVSP